MTRITRSLSVDGNYAPSAVNILGQIPEKALFNTAHMLRHPSSIYQLSLDKIADAFCKVAGRYLEKTQENRDYGLASLDLGQLLQDQVIFLHAVQEHLDELWLILRTLIDPNSATKTSEYNDKYVLENKLHGAKSFQDAIADYKKSLRIVNKLKHQQCYLRGVAVWSNDGVHLGYCLEEPDRQGVLGPSADIHPDQGAFSFARDLTWHLANMYLCSDKLVRAVTRALTARGIAADAEFSGFSNKWDKVIALACKIPPAIFPKECKKPLAQIQLDNESQTLIIRIPHHLRVDFPQPMKVRYSFTVEAHNRSTRVPLP